MLCTIFSIGHFEIFFLLSGFDISCKLSSGETICMKCQSLFFWKKQKNKQKQKTKKNNKKQLFSGKKIRKISNCHQLNFPREWQSRTHAEGNVASCFLIMKKLLTYYIFCNNPFFLFTTGLGGSVGCAVRLETSRSQVQPPLRPATFFRGD